MALTVAELIGKISLDVSGATASAQQLNNTLQNLSKNLQNATNAANQTGQSAQNAASGGMNSFFNSIIGGVAPALGLLSGASLGAIAGFVGLAGEALAIGKALEASTFAAISWGEEVRRIQIISDATAQQASLLAVTFDHFGINVDQAVRSLTMFERRLEAGTGGIKNYFSALEISNMQGKTLIQLLPLLQAKFQSLGTQTEQTTFLVDLFGARLGFRMHDLLAATGDDLKRITELAQASGLILNQSQVDAAHNAQLAWNDFKEALKGVEVVLGNALIPAFTTLLAVLRLTISPIEDIGRALVNIVMASMLLVGAAIDAMHGDFTSAFSTMKEGLRDFGRAGSDLTTKLGSDFSVTWDSIRAGGNQMATGVVMAFGEIGAALDADTRAWITSLKLTTQEMDAITKDVTKVAGSIEKAFLSPTAIIQDMTTAVKNNTKAQNQALTVANETISAARTQATDLRNIEKAQDAVNKAQQDFNLLAAGPYWEDVQKGNISIAQSLLSIHSAQQAVIDAQKTLSDMMTNAPKDLAAAQENVAKAQLGQKESALSLSDAQKNLYSLQGQGTTTLSQLEQAQIAVQRAQFGTTDSAITLTDAQAKLVQVQQDILPGSAAMVKAADAVASAQLNLQSAELANIDAIQKQNKLFTDSLPQSQAYQDSLMKLVDATDALAAAQQKQADDAERAANQAQKAANTEVGAVSGMVAAVTADFNAFRDATNKHSQDLVNYADNIIFLIKSKVDPTYLDTLMKEGSDKVAGTVQNMVNTVKSGNIAAINDMTDKITRADNEIEAARQFLDVVLGHPLPTIKTTVDTSQIDDALQKIIGLSSQIAAMAGSVDTSTSAILGDLGRMPDLAPYLPKYGPYSPQQLFDAYTQFMRAHPGALNVTGGATGGAQTVHHGGGLIMHSGGEVTRVMHWGGGLLSDERRVIAQTGEFMMSKPAVQSIGASTLSAMNQTGNVPTPASSSTSPQRQPIIFQAILDGKIVWDSVRDAAISDFRNGRISGVGVPS